MFALFCGLWSRNAEGGWGDFRDVFKTPKEAIQAFLELCNNKPDFKKYWFHIVDLEKCEIVINEYDFHLHNI